jgi:hypothetical protein
MVKLTVVAFSIVLTGCAAGGAWRDLRIDGADQRSFEDSVKSIQQELPENRREMFDWALAEIWVRGTIDADDSGGFSAAKYFGQLDGLGYDGVVKLAEAVGPSLLNRYARAQGPRVQTSSTSPWSGYQSEGFTEKPRTYPAASDPWRDYRQQYDWLE